MGIVNGVAGSAINASATVTPDGDEIAEGESENPFQSITNDLATIRDGALCNTDIRGAAGDPDDACGGTFKFYGAFHLLDNGSSVGAIRLGATTQIVADDPAAFLRFQARKRLNRPRVPLSDAPHTIGPHLGDSFQLNGAPAAARVITITKATGSPEEGERVRLYFLSVIDGSNALAYTVKRDDASTIATIRTTSESSDLRLYWMDVEYCLISTGPDVYDWRLGANSGLVWDTAAGPAKASGVIPGSSA